MFIEFQTIKEPLEEPLKTRIYSIEEVIFNCECGHIYYNHNLCEGECCVENCDCKKLVYTDLEIEIVYTTADLFEIENPDHSETDSPLWWIEFSEWYKSWQMTNI